MYTIYTLLFLGSNRQSSEGKHVMFSDGIRPGGDLTELDGADASNRLPIRRSGRSQKKVDKGSPGRYHINFQSYIF
jgi:hypothetical protein